MRVKSVNPEDLKTIYLAGPMSGIPDLNFPLFARVAKELRDLGYKIVSPHEHAAPMEDPHGYAWALARDILLVAGCDTIMFLPGWENSKGANVEFVFGEATGKNILTYNDFKSQRSRDSLQKKA